MSLKSNYEYIRDWCNHKFLTKDEQISVDLSNYYTKSEVDSAITDATDDIDLSNYVTDSELATGLSTKQNTISDLSTIRSNAAAGAAKVSNVQSDWNATSGLARILNKPDLDNYLTIEDYTQDEEVVAAALNDLNSNKQATLVSGTNIKTVNGTSLLGSGDIDVNLAESITWSALKTLRDNSNLVVGKLYRITDYVTTTVQTGTRSAGHPFDLIVLATAADTLSEDAKAIQHEGDAYFDNANLRAWEISYCLDNNDTRYVWADTENGKGVIWRMKDEWGNDCPFDFKNIMFERTGSWGEANPSFVRKVLGEDERSWDGGYFYALSRYDAGEVNDLSLVAKDIPTDEDEMPGCYGNVLSPLDTASQYASGAETSFMLPSIVIISSASYFDGFFNGNGNSYNVFGRNCDAITLGNACWGNRFGDQCINVVLGNDCYNNTFGNYCRILRFEDAVQFSSIGISCRNIDISYYVFGVTIGHQCEGIYCAYAEDIYIGSGTKYVRISGTNSQTKTKNCTILPGTSGTNLNNRLTIPFEVGKTYPQFAGMDSDGNLRVWCVADRDPKLVSISTASSTQSLVWGTMYQWTVNPTSITVTLPSAPSDPRGEIVLKFTTGSTAPTITWPSTLKWANGEELTVEASTTYEFSIGYDMMGGWTIIGCGFSAAS